MKTKITQQEKYQITGILFHEIKAIEKLLLEEDDTVVAMLLETDRKNLLNTLEYIENNNQK